MRENAGEYIVVVDGSVPLKDDGIYSTIAMGIFMVMLLQIGVGPALAHGISRAFAKGDREAEQHSYTTAFYVILLLASVGGLLVAAVVTFVPIPEMRRSSSCRSRSQSPKISRLPASGSNSASSAS